MPKKTETTAVELNEAELAVLGALTAQSEIAEEASAGEMDTTAVEPTAPVADPMPEIEVAETDDGVTFADLIASVDATETTAMMTRTAEQFDRRAEFERTKNPSNDNIQKTLSKSRKTFQGPLIAACMVALEMSPRMINDEERSGSRRNVYGLEKISDLLKALQTGVPGNAINQACVVSMFLFEKAGLNFTGADAVGATSDKVSVAPERAAHMKRHTVSASTAPTQMSSTMTALEAIGAVENIGTDKHKVFRFTKKPVVARLKEVFAPTV